MDEEKVPRVFANHVLKQMVQHMFGDDLIVERDDFLSLRIVFRRCGGTWTSILGGDLKQIELLKTLVTAWGNMPGRKHQSEVFV